MMYHTWEQRPCGYLWVCTGCGVVGGSHAATREEVAAKHAAHECSARLRAALDRSDAALQILSLEARSRREQ